MQIEFTGIVREIKDWTQDQKGADLPPEKVTSQILFLDRDSGGDVSITFPAGHGYKVGQDVNFKGVVRPVIRNFKLTLYGVVQPAKNNPTK